MSRVTNNSSTESRFEETAETQSSVNGAESQQSENPGANSTEKQRTSHSAIAKSVGRSRAEQGTANGAAKPRQIAGVDGETVYVTEVMEMLPIIDGFLYPGATIFNGRPKQGKSWLMLQVALGVVGAGSETTIAGKLKVRQPGKVLYLALEETPARTTRRLRKLKPQPNFLCDITFVYADEMQPALSGGIDQIAEYLEKHPATRLVVIDTLLAFQQRERKASTDIVQSDYNLIRPLQDLATQHDVAVVLVDHSRKMAGAAIDVVSGTTGKTAALDSVMSLQRQTDGTSLLTILSREMDETVYQLKIDSGDDGAHPFGWRILAEGEEAVASAERKEVIELLRDEASGLTSKEIARQTGRKEGATRMLLKRMADRGQVMRLDDNGKWRLL